jgi:hypothetical protein
MLRKNALGEGANGNDNAGNTSIANRGRLNASTSYGLRSCI